ncbi:thioredoxin domain-containing protein [Patescibacteria group bacterium]
MNDIKQWIQQARESGLSDKDIHKQLEKSGWTKDQVDQVLAAPPSPLQQKYPDSQPVKKKPWQSHTAETHKPWHTKEEYISDALGKKRKKSFKFSKWMVVAVIAVAVIGGGAFAYMKGYLPIPFLTKNAEEMLMKAFNELADAKSGEFGFTFQVVGEERTVESTSKNNNESAVGTTDAELQAQDRTTVSNAAQIKTALILYWDDHRSQFPNTLAEVSPNYISFVPKQANGESFIYKPSSDKTEYTLSFSCLGGNNKGPNGILDSDGNITSCEYDRDYGGSEFSDFYDDYMDLLVGMIPTDINVQGAISVFMNYSPDDPSENKGLMSLSGSYSSSGVAISVDLEARLKDNKAYLLANEFPALFFDTSSFKDKWIEIDLDEGSDLLGGFVDVNDVIPDDDTTSTFRSEVPHIFRVAFQEKLIVANVDGKETINGHPTHRVRITIDPEKLQALESAYYDDAVERGVDLGDFGDFTDSFSDPEVIDQLDTFFENTTLTVWVDQAGFKPRKMEVEMIAVPPDKYERLVDRQFRFNFGMTFDHLGEKPNVTKPSNTISIDEVIRLMTGITVEEQNFDKQRDAVSDIRSALRQYNSVNKKYPASLDKLLETPPEDSFYDSYFYSRSSVPTDIYTEKPFEYSTTGTDYKLIYEIEFPPESTESIFGSNNSYYTSLYVEGKNTATKDYVSLEAEENKDTDNDGLSDVEEAEFGTSKYVADTDGDGFTDFEEVQSGHNPLKAADDQQVSNTNSANEVVVAETYYLPLKDTDHKRGGENAKVTLVVYSDFECPFCARFVPTIEQLETTYGDDLQIVFRHYPLSFHTNAQKAAEASECAAEQGQFWEMHDRLFEMNAAVTLSVENYKSAAGELGLAQSQFDSCLDSGKYSQRVQDDIDGGALLGVQGTPATFVNGELISGAQPFDSYAEVIDDILGT